MSGNRLQKLAFCASLVAGAALPAVAFAAGPDTGAGDRTPEATAIFVGKDATPIGDAKLFETQSGVLIRVDVKNLPAGQWVAFHIHENGACSPGDHHKAAGGHFNPTNATHGFFAEGGPHAGDLPNQYVGADGVLRAEVFAPSLSLGGAGKATSDLTGRSLMIHAKGDDYASQPVGNAGERLACAPIKPAATTGK